MKEAYLALFSIPAILKGRVPMICILCGGNLRLRRVHALEAERNSCHATIDRRFTVRQARIKLQKLYPVARIRRD